MARKTYVSRNGKFVEQRKQVRKEGVFVHQDTMAPLKHPVTEKIFDSRSAYESENRRLGLKVVGNDLLSQRPRTVKDRLSDEQILDGIEQAEATVEDATKWRAHQNINIERFENHQRILNGKG